MNVDTNAAWNGIREYLGQLKAAQEKVGISSSIVESEWVDWISGKFAETR